MKHQTDHLRIRETRDVNPPTEVPAAVPVTDGTTQRVHDTGKGIHAILGERDDRLPVVIGPCSIHDPGMRPWSTRDA
jgi:3-deoxy-7-phosphoheptulonate synthase